MSRTLLIGTTKGAFVIDAEAGWALSGPFCGGWPINHVVGDPETGAFYAGGGNDFFGAGVWISLDGGQTWTLSKLAKGQLDEWAAQDPQMAEMFDHQSQETAFDGEIDAIWSLHAAHGAVHAGTKPANLFTSQDGGAQWRKNAALAGYDGRDDWNPGAAGLVLHTIVSAPDDSGKLWLGVSAAGVFASEDGGVTWERRNRLSNVDSHTAHHHHPAAPSGGETGHCVHHIERAAGTGDRLYQQNHHGVFRSEDGGRTWDDVTQGLPSTFGFPLAVHPHDRDVIWTIPLNGDVQGRYPPDAAAAVWRSTDAGQTWTAHRAGLPQAGCFFTVLRQAMATDRRTAPGVYFGTNTGSVFASDDAGETWSEVARHLPTVLSVECLER